MCAALAKHGVDYTIVQRIRATPEGRPAMVTLGGLSRSAHGEVSCQLWFLVVMLLMNC
jgi:hypothetical protein